MTTRTTAIFVGATLVLLGAAVAIGSAATSPSSGSAVLGAGLISVGCMVLQRCRKLRTSEPPGPEGFPFEERNLSLSCPTPARLLVGTIEAEDYPTAALSAEEEGIAKVLVTVDESGCPADVALLESSGSTSLDEATCKLILQRFRYQPATAGGRRACRSTLSHMVDWRLEPAQPIVFQADEADLQNE